MLNRDLGPFRRLTIPTGVHPLVSELFRLMNHERISIEAMGRRSGVAPNTIKNWRRVSNPRLLDLDACFGVLGRRVGVRTISHVGLGLTTDEGGAGPEAFARPLAGKCSA